MKAIFKQIEDVETAIQVSITELENMNNWPYKTAQDLADIEAVKTKLKNLRTDMLALLSVAEWEIQQKRINLQNHASVA